ncbi:hypothetical protein BHE74_00010500 [Ensete ventricosum]|nr:hypothetical protein BHE74_00010500 [Ensete ventricosum]
MGPKGLCPSHCGKAPQAKAISEIAFEVEETEYHDHNDAPVVLVHIANAQVKRVMIDTESSTDILYFYVFQKLGLTTVNLSPMNSILIEFTGDSIAPLGMTILLVTGALQANHMSDGMCDTLRNLYCDEMSLAGTTPTHRGDRPRATTPAIGTTAHGQGDRQWHAT